MSQGRFRGGMSGGTEWSRLGQNPQSLVRSVTNPTGGKLSSDSTALGNTVTYQIPVTIGPGGPTGQAEKMLVEADVRDLYPTQNFADGANWILTGGLYAANNDGVPLSGVSFRVRVQFGSGGALQELFVTAAPQFSLSLPGTICRASVLVGLNGQLATGFSLFEGTYRVSAMLHRGMPNGDAESRLYTFADELLPNTVGRIAIPAFAKRLQTLGSTADPVYGGGVALTFIPSGLDYSGPELLALKNAGTKIGIPGGSNVVRVTGLAGNLPPPLSWDIEV